MPETLVVGHELDGIPSSIPEAAGSLSLVPFIVEQVPDENGSAYEISGPRTEVIMIAHPWQAKKQIEGQLVIMPLADHRDQWKVVVH